MTKSKATAKSTTPSAPAQKAVRLPISERKKLLVTVAGPIVAGIMQDPSPGMTSAEKMAEAALDIAEVLLRQAGIEPDPDPNV